MENLAVYRNEALKENVFPIHKKTEQYQRLLDEATTRFNMELENIETKCLDSKENPDVLLNAVTKVMDNMNHVCEEFERGVGYNKDVIKESQITFRKKTDAIISKSYFANRARTWPEGYQGDYKTLETAYKNTPLSDKIGYYLDLYFLHTPIAEAVRNRLKHLEEILRSEISNRQRPSILNIACGSCRELMRITSEISASDAKIICIDNDNETLSFAQNRLSHTDVSSQIEFRKYNANRMFDPELNAMEFRTQDVIYSVGYFDYLYDEFLVKMLRALYQLLNPGGKLLAAFKDADYYKSQPYHWFVDWDGFLQRNEDDFDRLFEQAGIPGSALSKVREKSGVIIFYTATK